ncbi:MAG: alkyl sulfatase BDS1-like metallo-beta-lactamase superfamily hydrolase [Halieaceae bacterium]
MAIFRSVVLGVSCLSLALSLLACSDNTSTVLRSVDSDDAGHVAPTAHTLAAQALIAAAMPVDDRDFGQARRGLIAAPQNLKITAADGSISWDQQAYDFIQGDAPGSVNPSLWRQAQLNGIHGLFEVSPGIHQLRGFDLANLTLIDSDNGWIIVDPLTTEPNARAAIAFAREHLGNKKVIAVVFTHSHIDHFGGIDGAVTEVERQTLRVIAPVGFIEESVSENIMAGTVMQRRAVFMFGRNLPVSPRGHIDTGLGKEPARSGGVSILEPTDIISETGQELTVDGVRMVFQNAGGSEAPAELTFYLPEHKAFCGAEMVSRNMHNVYTPRGAKVRDAHAWSGFIDEALNLFGSEAEVYFASHHWPVWGNQEIVTFLKQQRDTYKFIHDQTLRLANEGATPREIAEQLALPSTLKDVYSSRGYYGTLSHNSKAVYQGYFGWYDGNPANFNPHPPQAAAQRYVELMGGADAVLASAQTSYDDGDYRWVAEIVNHVVFAKPDHVDARLLLASAYDQLGYQAESGPWRDIYLTGAYELRNGPPETGAATRDAAGIIERVPTGLFFDAMAASLNGERADAKEYTINMEMTDTGEHFVLSIGNSVMHYRLAPAQNTADATLVITRALFLALLTKEVSLIDALRSEDLSVPDGKLALAGFFSLFDPADPVFNIVTP